MLENISVNDYTNSIFGQSLMKLSITKLLRPTVYKTLLTNSSETISPNILKFCKHFLNSSDGQFNSYISVI